MALGFLRWSDVDYSAFNTSVDCRFEKALHDCCPVGCYGSALAMDLNMTSNFLGYPGGAVAGGGVTATGVLVLLRPQKGDFGASGAAR